MASITKACCEIPPIVTTGYKEKGKYIEVEGTKTYATGPEDATRGIFVVFDVFGFYPQTLQGADIMSTSDEKHKYKVFIPDFFDGKPISMKDYPPDTPEKQKIVADFFSGPAAMPPTVERATKLMKALQAENPHITKWATIGYCWGAKIVSLVVKNPSPFSAAAEVHPAFVDPADAAQIKIPMCMLGSESEDSATVAKFGEALTGPKHIEMFSDQIHGWMGARGDLSKDRVKSEYERGYKTVIEFFGEHL